LWEMLTGRRLFDGDSVPETLAGVLKTEIDFADLPAATPPSVRRLLQRCLERRPERRLRDLGDARLEIEAAGEEPETPAATAGPSRSGRWPWAAAGLAIGALATLALQPALRDRSSPPASQAVVRTAIALPPDTSLALGGFQPGPPALSPDGRVVALVLEEPGHQPRLWLRELARQHAHPLEGTDHASYPFWSPDSRRIAFFAAGSLRVIPAEGGPVVDLALAQGGKGGDWREDDTILFAPSFNSPIHRTSAIGGGVDEPITTLTEEASLETSHRFPQFLSGDRFLYLARTSDGNEVRIASLDGTSDEVVLEAPSHAIAAGEALLFLRDGFLLAQPFDPISGVLSGQPAPLAHDVSTIRGAGYSLFSVSEDRLVYLTGTAGTDEGFLVWLDRDGTPIEGPRVEPMPIREIALARGSDRIALSVVPDPAGNAPLFVVEPDSREARRVTFGEGIHRTPRWSPDARSLAYASNPGTVWGIYLLDLDSGGDGELLLAAEDPRGSLLVGDWSPDGRELLYGEFGGDTERLLAVEIGRPTSRRLLVEGNVGSPRISPDGRWLSYTFLTGRSNAIFVASLVEPERRWQVASGAFGPFWSPDGSELYYMDRDARLTAVAVRARADSFAWGPPEVLFEAPDFRNGAGGPDRFLTVARLGETSSDPPTLLLGWRSLLGAGSPD
ncbi:MAG: hypothetical protein R3190_11245, partial [Thermoanaerobaculia bacterium]|nr:hypothetical protein [Thermoanaerobaculia bacterium]